MTQVEKETCEAKLSKLRLQNKAKVTSLNTQLEELKKQQGGPGTPTHSKKVLTHTSMLLWLVLPVFWQAYNFVFVSLQGSSEGGGDQANRGKIVLLKKKVEELEQQLARRVEELENKVKHLRDTNQF